MFDIMKIVILGASGLLGSTLMPRLKLKYSKVYSVGRSNEKTDGVKP